MASFFWIFVFLHAFLLFILPDPHCNGSFNRAVWIENRNSDNPDNPRGPMAADLRKRLLQEKPTKAEVLAILSEPDMMSERNKLRPDFLSYGLGMWSGFRIDYDSLDIYFDDHDRVSKVLIVQH